MKRIILTFLIAAAAVQANAAGLPTLRNSSALVHVDSGGSATLGFISDRPGVFLIRAIGPTLSEFGVRHPAGHPTIALFQGVRQIASNNIWCVPAGADVNTVDGWLAMTFRGPRLNAIAQSTGAFPISRVSADEAALAIRLDAGAYTVRITNVGEAGDALIEIYATAENSGTDSSN